MNRRVTQMEACAEMMFAGEVPVTLATDGDSTHQRLDTDCPVHHGRDCLDVFFAAGDLADWSLFDFLRERRIQRWRRRDQQGAAR